MNLAALSALTPYATFFLAVIIGIIGWFLKWMINGNHRQFGELQRQIRHLGIELKDLEKSMKVAMLISSRVFTRGDDCLPFFLLCLLLCCVEWTLWRTCSDI